jgi:hypothetical protein
MGAMITEERLLKRCAGLLTKFARLDRARLKLVYKNPDNQQIQEWNKTQMSVSNE